MLDLGARSTLDGAVGIVTGAGQGIGRTFATALARAGARVVVADLDAARAEQTADELRADGHGACAVQVDVADEDSVAAMVATTMTRYGRVDVLLNNAAVFSTLTMKPFDEISASEWRRVLDVNLTGVFLCCRAVAGPMREQRGGSIINMSSASVLGGRPNYLHYVTSKAGIVGLTRAMARELGGRDIRVNALMPGSVDTGIPRDSARPGAVDEIVANQALRRRLEPADIAGMAVFLASDAARAITGQTIVIDGGMNFL
ncbi:SDR family NAD(P)-dependent oxidoreductase [Geodermatophilus sp. CPCC 206100]|uniref:SDR family NAD(P)-dependent oxidoreductase n=1 Tax=Geodermatophilus sp. CPCC 206100 TaxID=3020054 RepID=UPI003AFF7B05